MLADKIARKIAAEKARARKVSERKLKAHISLHPEIKAGQDYLINSRG